MIRFFLIFFLITAFFTSTLAQTKFNQGWVKIQGTEAIVHYSQDDNVLIAVTCADRSNTGLVTFINNRSKQFYESRRFLVDAFAFYSDGSFSSDSLEIGRLDLLSSGNGWSFLANPDFADENLFRTADFNTNGSSIIIPVNFPRSKGEGLLSESVDIILNANILSVHAPRDKEGDTHIYSFQLEGVKTIKSIFSTEHDNCAK